MYQKHPIRVDKSRALPSVDERHATGSTQVSFHKIYRQKRCYSNFGKGKEWHPSNRWKSECGDTLRESNFVLESGYSAGHGGFEATCRTDIRQTANSGSPSSPYFTGSTKSDRDFPKRSHNRLLCNFTPRSEFDAPVAKKPRAEYRSSASQQYASPEFEPRAEYRSSAPQQYASPEFEHSNQKLSLDETKWMYKNQHAKMSGPYGVNQLMEGLQAHFLQEDLPIYQLHEGTLCEPITLKQLMDEVQQSRQDSGRRHANQSMPNQQFLQVFKEERVSNDDDLPPGFGGHSSQFSQNPSHDYSPNSMSSIPGSRCSAHSFSSGSDFGDTDIVLPPGFEGGAAMESQASELCGTPQNLPMSVGVAARRGVRVMHLGYEQLEPMVGDGVHSNLGYAKQGTNSGSEFPLNGHTSWPYTPAARQTPSFEPQSLLQPTVCLGLPVSKPATQSWPIASSLPYGVFKTEYGYADATTLANNTLAIKEPVGFPERQSPDALSLILTELLTAVKKTYVKSVLTALIGEQLDCWLNASKHWMGRSLSLDKDSPARGSYRELSRTEVGICSAEVSASHVEASRSESQQVVSIETRQNAILSSEMQMSNTSLLSNDDKNNLGASKMSLSHGKTENFSLGPYKEEPCLSNDAACKLSSKSSSSLDNESGLTFVVCKEENQHKSGDESSYNDASNGGFQPSGNTSDTLLQKKSKPILLAARSKKGSMKSLKQLRLITSKLRMARLKISSLKESSIEQLRSNSPEVVESMQTSGLLASEQYHGCARTSVCGYLRKNGAQDDVHHVDCCQIKDQSSMSRESGMQTLTHSAQTSSSALRCLTAAVEGLDAVKLAVAKRRGRLKVARSKIHNWGVFSLEAVEAGDFVIEYLGELVRSRVADIREDHYAKSGIGSGYLFRIDNEFAVDATKRGGLARFINHSCDPNCFIKIVMVEGSKRVLIFAKRHIQAGEEVTYDYKSGIGVLIAWCNCGSSECRGSPM